MGEQQEQFLKDELFSLTLMATVQRANIHVAAADPRAKKTFQTALRTQLEYLATLYGGAVCEEEHIRNIVGLSDRFSADHADVLVGGRSRIGAAQKALNLWLKYLWCIGKLPAPPHCPFDSQIIAKLPGRRGINWTALDDVAEYRRLVAAAKLKAGRLPLAVWELRTYNSA
jgi:hypothetical protein